MQAPLSSTASGRPFTTGTLTAVPPALPNKTFSRSRRPGGRVSEVSRLTQPHPATPLADGRGLAHDAGNLMGALGLYCDLLALPGVLRDEHRHYAAELQMLSGRSRDLIHRLLSPATTGPRPNTAASQITDSVEQIVVPDVIEGCRGLLNAVARRAIAVAYSPGAALPVAVSREALERILVNLTKNAAEAAPEANGPITLRVTCRQEEGAASCIVLTVEDKGRGMSTAAVRVLMSERAGESAKTGPHGIGFQVVKELVGASGGQLRLRSRSGGAAGSGTTVEITWKVSAIGAVAHELTAESELPRFTNRRGLMLVDDRDREGPGGMSC